MSCKRIFLLALVGGCLKIGALGAQPPVATQTILPTHGTVVVSESDEGAAAPQKNRPLLKMFNSHGLGCASNFNEMGCGSAWSELTFMFGSCRTFFGQSCEPKPPHSGAGNGAGAGGQKCCGN